MESFGGRISTPFLLWFFICWHPFCSGSLSAGRGPCHPLSGSFCCLSEAFPIFVVELGVHQGEMLHSSPKSTFQARSVVILSVMSVFLSLLCFHDVLMG